MGVHLRGTWALLRNHLHAGWRGLVAWSSLMSGLVLAVGASIEGLYATLPDRLAYAGSAGSSPAMQAFNGRAYDLTQTGGIVSYEVGFMGLIVLPIVAVHLAIRFSRHEEDAGRTELVTAGRVGRLAPLTAAALAVAVCLVGFVLVSASALTAVGLPAGGSWRYAASLGLLAAAFAALGLLAAEVSRESRAAYGLGLAVALLTFLARAVVDGYGWRLVWVSPSGWLAEVRPWGAWQWWPFLAYAATTALVLGLAGVIALRRDLNGGLVAVRPGPAYGAPALGTPAGLAWRFTRAPLLSWLLGTAVWNAGFGGLAGEMEQVAEASPALLEAMGVERPEHLVTSLAILLCGVGASAFGVQAVARLATEEAQGRIGMVLSTRTSRSRLWVAWLAVVLAGSAAVLWVSALSLAVCTALSTGEAANLADTLGAGLTLVAPVALLVGLAAALQAVRPRLTALAWLAVGWVAVVGLLGETLRLPGWARDLSPVHAAGRVPIEDARVGALMVIAVVTVSLLAGGLARFRRRQLVAG